jgi:hypothetical protein
MANTDKTNKNNSTCDYNYTTTTFTIMGAIGVICLPAIVVASMAIDCQNQQSKDELQSFTNVQSLMDCIAKRNYNVWEKRYERFVDEEIKDINTIDIEKYKSTYEKDGKVFGVIKEEIVTQVLSQTRPGIGFTYKGQYIPNIDDTPFVYSITNKKTGEKETKYLSYSTQIIADQLFLDSEFEGITDNNLYLKNITNDSRYCRLFDTENQKIAIRK